MPAFNGRIKPNQIMNFSEILVYCSAYSALMLVVSIAVPLVVKLLTIPSIFIAMGYGIYAQYNIDDWLLKKALRMGRKERNGKSLESLNKL